MCQHPNTRVVTLRNPLTTELIETIISIRIIRNDECVDRNICFHSWTPLFGKSKQKNSIDSYLLYIFSIIITGRKYVVASYSRDQTTKSSFVPNCLGHVHVGSKCLHWLASHVQIIRFQEAHPQTHYPLVMISTTV